MSFTGKLGWDSIPFHEPLPLVSAGIIGLVLLGVFVWVWRRGHLP